MSDINLPPFKNKVICINNTGWYYEKSFLIFNSGVDIDGPKYNEECTVTEKHTGKDGIEYYRLLEWPNDPNGDGWQADCFAIVQENFQSISLEKILEEETKLISVN